MTSEKSIDRAFCNYAKAAGLTTIKLTAAGRYGASGWPDRLVIGPAGVFFFVEIKRPGGRLTALQAARQAALRAHGHRVLVVDGFVRARVVVDCALGDKRKAGPL